MQKLPCLLQNKTQICYPTYRDKHQSRKIYFLNHSTDCMLVFPSPLGKCPLWTPTLPSDRISLKSTQPTSTVRWGPGSPQGKKTYQTAYRTHTPKQRAQSRHETAKVISIHFAPWVLNLGCALESPGDLLR